MREYMKEVPIFFAADHRYFPYLAVTVESIIEHSSEDTLYRLYVICDGVSDSEWARLVSLERDNLVLCRVEPSERFSRVREKLCGRLRDYYSEAIYYRMFIASAFPKLHRAIYLDCDLVLNADVGELYSSDLHGCVVGAVRDESIPRTPAFAAYVERWVGVPVSSYFNSGVLVIDLDAFRRERVEERFLEHLFSHDPDTVAPDQDYLNRLLLGRVFYLGAEWNKQACRPRPAKVPKLIHYNFYMKPWHYRGVPYEEYFWHYAARTPYFTELRLGIDSYTDEQRDRDGLGGVRLLRHAQSLADSGGCFADPSRYAEDGAGGGITDRVGALICDDFSHSLGTGGCEYNGITDSGTHLSFADLATAEG